MKIMKNPKAFSKQFQECKRDGFTGKGELEKFSDHPELLPPLPRLLYSKKFKKFKKWVETDPNAGLETIKCLRFGGVCNSGHKDCRKLRGYKE